MKLPNYLVTLVMLPIIGSGQIDKPISPEDFADKMAAERTKIQDQMKVLVAVRDHLNALADWGNSTDPGKRVPLVHADLLVCLAKGDFSRTESRLYEAAAVAAGQVAHGWELKANSPEAVTATASEEAFARQLEELERRIAELTAKAVLTEDDRGELIELQSHRKQLREVLDLLTKVRAASEDRTKYATAAQQMRTREHVFQLKAQDSSLQALEQDIQCLSAVRTLRELNERDQIQKELRRWEPKPAVEFDSTAARAAGSNIGALSSAIESDFR